MKKANNCDLLRDHLLCIREDERIFCCTVIEQIGENTGIVCRGMKALCRRIDGNDEQGSAQRIACSDFRPIFQQHSRANIGSGGLQIQCEQVK